MAEQGSRSDADEQDPMRDESGPGFKPPREMSACFEEFSRTFEASARRWELVVYPSLIAFIILAAYGFFLIYSLTTDVARVARQMNIISESMISVSENMEAVSGNIALMSDNMDKMAVDMRKQERSFNTMVGYMDGMNNSMKDMTVTMYYMRQDMASMGYNIHSASGPMRMMNNFMPW
jgi:uncharacterized protein YoxC